MISNSLVASAPAASACALIETRGMDVSLPEMDGTEVLKKSRLDEQLRELPVIALTAHAMAGDREKFIKAGFDDYVTKPIVDERLLLDAIARLLPGKQVS